MALTDTALKALKARDKTHTVTDDRGLYVEIFPTGDVVWRYRYRLNGKDVTIPRRYLEKDILPHIGSKPVRDITAEDVRSVIWRMAHPGGKLQDWQAAHCLPVHPGADAVQGTQAASQQ